MEQDFYRQRLETRHAIEVLVPSEPDRDIVHRIIYEELCLGKIVESSRLHYRRIIAQLVASGAQAIVLGCTEIAMLVQANDATVPLFDTTRIHALQAAQWAMSAP